MFAFRWKDGYGDWISPPRLYADRDNLFATRNEALQWMTEAKKDYARDVLTGETLDTPQFEIVSLDLAAAARDVVQLWREFKRSTPEMRVAIEHLEEQSEATDKTQQDLRKQLEAAEQTIADLRHTLSHFRWD